jgi:thiamine pyrophosphate-dependent acetolactate synthase large subunit-like protein
MLMADFSTACLYGLPIKVIINNNASLGQIMWELLVLGYPEYGIRFETRRSTSPRRDTGARCCASTCGTTCIGRHSEPLFRDKTAELKS